jgi:hypothetical protein
MSRYFLEKSLIYDHRIAESHIKILVHILVLLSDTLDEIEEHGKSAKEKKPPELSIK